ncbi:MAG: efflux transporter outer membrane subunit [Acidiferrobacterales bacterium]
MKICRRFGYRFSGIVIATMALVMAGCAFAPSRNVQALPSAASYPMARSVKRALASPEFRRGSWPVADWWSAFGDAQLDSLIGSALARNPDLDVARSRLVLARQAAATARAALFPDLGVSASVTREKFSANGLFPPPFAGATYNQGQLSLDFGYNLDLWGRARDEFRARLGEARAAAAQAAEARLIISTAVASAYFQLQEDLSRLEVTGEGLAQRKAFERLVRLRAANGLETQLAVKQAQADVESAEASIIRLQNSVASGKRALVALMGEGPDASSGIKAPTSRFDRPFPVPAGLPMDLLARRPDIMVRRWQVEAAAQEIGAARAGFYPNVSLTAQIGKQSVELHQLFDPGSDFALVGPAIHLPIFEGGRLRAALNARYAQYDIAVDQYRRALIDAARDVADRLATLESVTQELKRQTEARRASEDAYRLAMLRYKSGLTDYLTVLLVQQEVFQQRDIEAVLRAQRLQAVLALIKALGGGYGQVR